MGTTPSQVARIRFDADADAETHIKNHDGTTFRVCISCDQCGKKAEPARGRSTAVDQARKHARAIGILKINGSDLCAPCRKKEVR